MTLGLGEDDIYTGNGDNYIESPEIFAYTGTGNDTIVAMGSDYYDDSWIKDTGGDDSITCGNGWDSIDISGGGKDTIATGGGRDAIQYTGGDAAKGIGATIDAGEGDDGIHADVALSVNGGSDEDEMWGDAFGGTGADHIFVATPLGPIFAGIGNDYVRTIAAATIFGGDGNDDIHTGDQRDSIYCGAGRDTVHAGNASDLISGGGGRDVLFGQGGKDRIYAGAGNDLIFGQGGNDRLVGATGADTLNGGDGDDQADKHEDEGDVVIGVEL
jgi:Ca2+-binding RTX toxin-like protein